MVVIEGLVIPRLYTLSTIAISRGYSVVVVLKETVERIHSSSEALGFTHQCSH